MNVLGRALVVSISVLALSACAVNRAGAPAPDFAAMPPSQALSALADLTERYKADPRNRDVTVHYAAALRSQGQAAQAVIVLETGMSTFPGDIDVTVAYAKALTADGRFMQALNVIDTAIRPEAPDWNALSVKGAILDQLGRNQEAREVYFQAMVIAPGEASLVANLGLSYSLTNDLVEAERYLRQAVAMPGATAQIRQNLALVLGLQGRFEEARAIYAQDLQPAEVEANMAYLRGMLSQQNRWDLIENG